MSRLNVSRPAPIIPTLQKNGSMEVWKTFDEPIAIEKWEQVTKIERVDENDFIDTLIKAI